jgi:hypothetical protein
LHAAPIALLEVDPEFVWAAIDCPGAYAVGAEGRGDIVLGRMTARVDRVPEAGEVCVAASWPLGEDGRKLHAGTALFAASGDLLAIARQTWIASEGLEARDEIRARAWLPSQEPGDAVSAATDAEASSLGLRRLHGAPVLTSSL